MTTTTIMASRRCDDDDDCELVIDNNDNEDDDYADGFDWCQTTRKLKTKQNKTKRNQKHNCAVNLPWPTSQAILWTRIYSFYGEIRHNSFVSSARSEKKSVSVSRSRGFQSRPDQHSGPQSNKICPGMPSIDQFRYFQIQLLTIQFSTRLGGINHTKKVFYSPEARAEVYRLQLNFKISKMAYHIHGYLNKRHTMFPDPFR